MPNVNLKVGVLAVTVAIWAATAASAAEPVRSTEFLIGPDQQQKKMLIQYDPAAYNLLPARIKADGKVIAGLEANSGYPVSIQKDGKNYGLSPDLGNALGAVLGVNVIQFVMPFSSIMPSLGAGRFDFSPNVIGDMVERRQVVDFIDVMYNTGSSFVLKKGSAVRDMTIETSCGHVLAMALGSRSVVRVNDASKKCVEQGKMPIDLKQFPSNAEVLLAVKSGRVEAGILEAAGVKYALRWDPERDLELGTTFNAKMLAAAMAFQKGSDLVPAFRAAMLSLHKSGAWKEILAQYDLEDGLPSVALIENTKPLPLGSPLP